MRIFTVGGSSVPGLSADSVVVAHGVTGPGVSGTAVPVVGIVAEGVLFVGLGKFVGGVIASVLVG
jgi:hypothetical protein